MYTEFSKTFYIRYISSEPALVLALRGIDAFHRLEGVIPLAQPGKGKDSHVDYIMSRNAEESYGFARAFFTDKEIFSDPTARHMLMYLPQVRHHIQGFGSRYTSICTFLLYCASPIICLYACMYLHKRVEFYRNILP